MPAIRKTDPPRGVLHPRPDSEAVRSARYEPSPAARALIVHHWTGAWALPPGQLHPVQTTPGPEIQLVWERGASKIVGVQTLRFTRHLQGSGEVVAVKLRPAALSALCDRQAHQLTDKQPAMGEVLGPRGVALETRLFEARDPARRIELVEEAVLSWAQPLSEAAQLAMRLAERAEQDTSLLSVAGLAATEGVQVRTMQRLFSRFIGASPKWLLRRARLHEALARLDAGDLINLADLALDLGYSDQAHFIRDFTAVAGVTPGAYLKAR